MRVTDAPTMDVVEMVLVGKVNKEIVDLINQHGGKAVGLSGKDGELIQAAQNADFHRIAEPTSRRRSSTSAMVGQVEEVNPAVLEHPGTRPVSSPSSPRWAWAPGETYNINADLVAGQSGRSPEGRKAHMLTDVEGVLDDGRT